MMETWLILLAICVLFLLLIITVVVLIAYSGAFERFEIKAGQPPIGKVTIAYKFFRGQYASDVGPEFFEVAKIAPDNKAIAIYYDEPHHASSGPQRFMVACILAEDEEELDGELVKKFEDCGYKVTQLPLVQYAVHTSFPYRSALSVFIGMKKAYPNMQQYIREHGLEAHPFIEIYTGSTIHYMAPLDKQESFYVPEALQPSPGEEPHEKSLHSGEPEGDTRVSKPTESDTDRPETQSLLHPSQIVKAEVIGRVEEEMEKTGAKEEDEDLEKASAEDKDESPEPESSAITGEGNMERGSDEESGSSFEDLKLEAEEVPKSETDKLHAQ